MKRTNENKNEKNEDSKHKKKDNEEINEAKCHEQHYERSLCQFPDVILYLSNKKEGHQIILHLSKYILSRSFPPFRHSLHRTESIFCLVLDSCQEMNHLADLLCLICNKDYNLKNDTLFDIIEVAIKFKSEIGVKQCSKKLSNNKTIDMMTAKRYLKLTDKVKQGNMSDTVVKKVLLKAQEFIVEWFKLKGNPQWHDVSSAMMRVLLQSDDVEVESENSLLYFLFSWAYFKKLKEVEKGKKSLVLNKLQELLRYIRFSQLSSSYLLDILNQVVRTEEFKLLNDFVQDQARLSNLYHLGGPSRFFHLRPDYKDSQLFGRRKHYCSTHIIETEINEHGHSQTTVTTCFGFTVYQKISRSSADASVPLQLSINVDLKIFELQPETFVFFSVSPTIKLEGGREIRYEKTKIGLGLPRMSDEFKNVNLVLSSSSSESEDKMKDDNENNTAVVGILISKSNTVSVASEIMEIEKIEEEDTDYIELSKSFNKKIEMGDN